MSKDLNPARHASRYTDSEIELGLRALAFASGNARTASTLLSGPGMKIPRTTLQLWASDLHADRYRQIQRNLMPVIYDRIAEDSERIVQDLAELEAQLVDRLREQAGDLAPRDTAGAIRNVSVAKAVNIDKAAVIRGRPTEITGTVDVNELLREFRQRWAHVIVSSPSTPARSNSPRDPGTPQLRKAPRPPTQAQDEPQCLNGGGSARNRLSKSSTAPCMRQSDGCPVQRER